MGDRGVSIVTLIALPPKHIHEMTGSERQHGHNPEAQHDIEHRNMVTRSDVPEVNEDDAQTVEGVEDDRANEPNLGNTHEGSLVGTNDGVVCLGAHTHEGRVQDVDKQEEVNTNAGDPVENPGPHAFAAAVKSSSGDDTFLAGGGHFNSHRG